MQEILLGRSTDIGAELLRRQDDGTWPETPLLIGENGELALASIEFRSPLAAFYEETYLRHG